jgi:glutamate-1-semialdehyde 2,1-aminomutase
LLCYSKALANGYPLAALLGKDSLRDAAKKVFVTGTFFTQAVPLAASLATLDEIEATGAIGRMNAAGKRLCDGLQAQARAADFEVTVSGPSSIPFMSFVADDGGFDRNRVFAGACARRGVFLHPVHNWFLSAAHTDGDIDAALEVTRKAFAEVRERFA